jgi:flavin-dependent dehydrogenase
MFGMKTEPVLKRRMTHMRTWGLVAVAAGWGALAHAAAVVESARDIPVAHDVDVVVVGGSCGAVAAAEAAANAGAKVFLAAPRPYLGDDLAGSLRLWLEPDEKPVLPLAKAVFVQSETALPFTYTADVPSGGKHKDSGAMLCDGKMDDVQHQTVEYAQDVAILADLHGRKEVASVELVAFRREGDFDVASAHLSVSEDGTTWSPAIPLKPEASGRAPDSVSFSAPLNRTVSWIKVAVKKPAKAQRLLVSEILFRSAAAGTATLVPTPLRVKQALDKVLIDSGAAFLTSTYATDVLRDAQGAPAGIVIANRSGRQAVKAKIIVDATDRALVARLAGARFRPYPQGPQTFERVVIAGEKPAAPGMTVKELPGDYTVPLPPHGNPNAGKYKRIEGRAYLCTLAIDMPDGSFRSFAEAEQLARDRTFVKTLLDASDSLFQVPPDAIVGAVPRVRVLGGCADIPREAAARLLRPLALMDEGARIGAEAAREAAALPPPKVAGRMGAQNAARGAQSAEVKELLGGLRPFVKTEHVHAEAGGLPVLGAYDVVVVGGGTGGAPTGIGAGRQGAKTLVIEHLYGLGGVGTLGMIGKYWYGNACGFTAEHDKGVAELGAAVHVVGKSEWWRRENRRAGAEIWFGAMGCGTLEEGNRVTGVVVATPGGRGVVLAKSVVDATGNAEIAASAGAETVFQGADELAVQGAGLSLRTLGASYINSDFGYVNDSDAADLWLFGVRGRAGAKGGWDISQIVETRERQRIVGDAWVTPLDIVNDRTFPDTIVRARSNFDSHGYSIADITYVSEPVNPKGGRLICEANVPYRALLPKNVEGVAVIGLGISAHRDAMPIMRMQPDIQNMGYAAGVAAATAAREGKTFRTIDVKALQRHLTDKGNIPADAPEWKDNAIVTPERLALAVKHLGDRYHDVSLVLAQSGEALPLLRRAYAGETQASAKLVYAHVLGILGDATGAQTLLDVVSGKTPLQNLGTGGEKAFGRRMSDFDSYVVALGRTRDRRALEPLLAEVRKLDARAPFMRFRSLTLALEALGDPAAAQPLAELLRKPGVGGHALTDPKKAAPQEGFGGAGSGERNLVLRELAVARALVRCGDFEETGAQTLKTYATDLRGIYALHAAEVLKQKGRELRIEN